MTVLGISISLLFSTSICNALTNLAHVSYSNTSILSPASVHDYLSDPIRGTSLFARQSGQCSAGPGGPICSATTCCPAGQFCCGVGCCGDSDNCFENGTGCCPKDAQTCGGKVCCDPGTVCCSAASTGCCNPGEPCCSQSPTGCCISGGQCCENSPNNPCCGPNETCCGNTCCSSNQVCELGECISSDTVKSGRIVRFKLDWKKNGLLLRNMCNGMRGQNTITLTYSGKISKSAKAAKRRAAGCVSGYCRGMINSGTITSDLNSCDEFPPASSDEGGNALPAIERAVNCIPGFQNNFQGYTFSAMVRSSGIQAGEEFVISIDCKEVLNSINRRRALKEEPIVEERRIILKTRDTISIAGTTGSNNTFNLPNDTTTYVSAPFGDLDPGTYTAQVQVISGSTSNGIVIANEGDTYTNYSQGIGTGQVQQFMFTLDYSDVGLGIIFVVPSNSTVIKWTLDGTLTPSGTTTSVSASATGSIKNSASTIGMFTPRWEILVIGITMLQFL